MNEVTASGRREPAAVPHRRMAGNDEEPRSAWASEETVPLRVATERVETEERADRLCIVTGRRSRGR